MLQTPPLGNMISPFHHAAAMAHAASVAAAQQQSEQSSGGGPPSGLFPMLSAGSPSATTTSPSSAGKHSGLGNSPQSSSLPAANPLVAMGGPPPPGHPGGHPMGPHLPPPPHLFPHHHGHHPHLGLEPPRPRFMFKMPRVVPNQKEKFETDDLMKRHSREGEVRFYHLPHIPKPHYIYFDAITIVKTDNQNGG